MASGYAYSKLIFLIFFQNYRCFNKLLNVAQGWKKDFINQQHNILIYCKFEYFLYELYVLNSIIIFIYFIFLLFLIFCVNVNFLNVKNFQSFNQQIQQKAVPDNLKAYNFRLIQKSIKIFDYVFHGLIFLSFVYFLQNSINVFKNT